MARVYGLKSSHALCRQIVIEHLAGKSLRRRLYGAMSAIQTEMELLKQGNNELLEKVSRQVSRLTENLRRATAATLCDAGRVDPTKAQSWAEEHLRE
jgi:hypothetical protein